MENKLLSGLKEVGLYLGQKLDDLKRVWRDDIDSLKTAVKDSQKNVQLDLTTRAIEKLQDTSNIGINQVVKALERVSKEEGTRLQELTRVISALQRAVEADNSETTLLRGVLTQLEGIADALRKDDDRKEKSTEAAEMKAEIRAIVAAIKANQPPAPKPVDFGPVTDGIKQLKATIADLGSLVTRTNSNESLQRLHDAIKAIKFEFPKTITLDENQFRALRNAGGGGGGTAQPLSATSATVTNVAMTTADTEYTHVFPANTVGFELRVRDTDVPLLVAYTAGKLPTSGDGSAYFTVPAYFVEKTPGIDWSGKTIYVQTASASQVLEIINYTA